MTKHLFIKEVEELIANMSVQDAADYFVLMHSPEWKRVFEAGEKASNEQMNDLKVVIINQLREDGKRLVSGRILSDNELLRKLVDGMTRRFYN